MIKADIAVAAAILMSVVVLIFLGLWLARGSRSRAGVLSGSAGSPAEHVRQCPYCGHVSVDHQKMKISVCSICRSYIEEE